MTLKHARQQLIIIVGPTASGKSELAVKIAKIAKNAKGDFRGAIISADSRQIYQDMNIGTGKVTGHFTAAGIYLYKGVRHYGIDIANPKRQYSVAQFQQYAQKAIRDITEQGLIPIICGGTAHWIDAVAFNQAFPQIKPDVKLRRKLERYTTAEMFKQLQKLDPDRARDIDPHNPRRLVRALEIVINSGQPVPRQSEATPYDILWLGLGPQKEVLEKKITRRLKQWLRDGMLQEIQSLRKQGLSWKRLESFGLEYRFGSLYLQGKISHEEMFAQSDRALKHYVKRQMTWWKKNKNIHWSDNSATLFNLVKNRVFA